MTTHQDMVYALSGVPTVGGTLPTSTGVYWFVDSGTGFAENTGDSITSPMATIDQAINLATASRGDVIVVFPGHAETIAAATSLVCDVAGLSIIGLGHGRNRPVLSFSATASRIPISADNVFVSGLVFLGAVADIVSGVTITGDDVTLQNCDFEVGSATLEFLQMLDIDAATRANIIGCRLIASVTAGTNTGVRVDATTDCSMVNCELRGDFTTAAFSGNAGTGAASTNFKIANCVVENIDTTAGLVIDHHDDSTGITYNTRMFSHEATNLTSYDPGDTFNNENHLVNAVNETGVNVPTTESA